MNNIAALLTLFKEKDIDFLQNEPMSAHTTFKVGGPAELYVFPRNEREISLLFTHCNREGIPVHIVGKGSDLLISDDGIKGVVLDTTKYLTQMSLTDETTIFCQSGASLSRLCLFAMERSLAGLEFAYGIPGSVGGAVYMDAGAYGGEMKDVAVRVFHVDTGGNPGVFAAGEADFSYRHSRYMENDFFITGVELRLQKGDNAQIKEKMDAHLDARKSKQPLEYPSAGSAFKRPEGAYASALIEQCGLKGLTVGGAQVSEKHAGFIINTGGATFRDVETLMRLVAETVKDKTGFILESEIKIIR